MSEEIAAADSLLRENARLNARITALALRISELESAREATHVALQRYITITTIARSAAFLPSADNLARLKQAILAMDAATRGEAT